MTSVFFFFTSFARKNVNVVPRSGTTSNRQRTFLYKKVLMESPKTSRLASARRSGSVVTFRTFFPSANAGTPMGGQDVRCCVIFDDGGQRFVFRNLPLASLPKRRAYSSPWGGVTAGSHSRDGGAIAKTFDLPLSFVLLFSLSPGSLRGRVP